MSTPALSADACLDGEQRQDTRHASVHGAAFAMAGVRDAQATVAGNVFVMLRQHLHGAPCRTFIGDMRPSLQAARATLCPDVFVTGEMRATARPRPTRTIPTRRW